MGDFVFFKIRNIFNQFLEVSPSRKPLKDGKEILELNSILLLDDKRECEIQICTYRATYNSFVAFPSINSEIVFVSSDLLGELKIKKIKR